MPSATARLPRIFPIPPLRAVASLVPVQARIYAPSRGSGAVAASWRRRHAIAAALAKGNRRDVPDHAIHPLGDLLADESLGCTIGSSDIYFDAMKEVLLISADGSGLNLVPFSAKYRVRTDIIVS